MSKNNNQSAASVSKTVSKEEMERLQKEFATKLGCDMQKKVSGQQYLQIFIMSLFELGALEQKFLPLAFSAATGMKANSSALRQWLYESNARPVVSADHDALLSKLGINLDDTEE